MHILYEYIGMFTCDTRPRVEGVKYEVLLVVKLGDGGEGGLVWGNSINRMGAGWDSLRANCQAASEDAMLSHSHHPWLLLIVVTGGPADCKTP